MWPQDGKISRTWRDKETHLQEKFRVRLLNDESIKWLYSKRMNDCLQHYEENIDVEQEWDNIKNILWKTAEASLCKIKVIHKGDN
jgi:hypothetical protein